MLTLLVALLWIAGGVYFYGHFVGYHYYNYKDVLGLDLDTIFIGTCLAIAGGPISLVILTWILWPDFGIRQFMVIKPYFSMTPEQPHDPKYRTVYPKDRRS